MALQLAWNLDQGKPTAVYETASTRLYLHGRTEVIRSFSIDSLRWVQAMNDPSEKVCIFTKDTNIPLMSLSKALVCAYCLPPSKPTMCRLVMPQQVQALTAI